MLCVVLAPASGTRLSVSCLLAVPPPRTLYPILRVLGNVHKTGKPQGPEQLSLWVGEAGSMTLVLARATIYNFLAYLTKLLRHMTGGPRSVITAPGSDSRSRLGQGPSLPAPRPPTHTERPLWLPRTADFLLAPPTVDILESRTPLFHLCILRSTYVLKFDEQMREVNK